MRNFTLEELDFSLPNTQGGQKSLQDYPESQAFVIVFTCNHCPYAIAYEQRLIKLHKILTDKGVPLIAISSNDVRQYPQDSFENMIRRAEEKGFPFPYLYDESQEVAKNFDAKRTPHAFLLAKNFEGLWQIVYSGAIDDNYRSEQNVKKSYLLEATESVLAQETVSQSHIEAVGCTIKWKQ
ncbi:MAG: thioredoxin family protein [Bacteroidota bacterium]